MKSSPIPSRAALILTAFVSSLTWAQNTDLIHILSTSAPVFAAAEWSPPGQTLNGSAVERVLILEGDAFETAPKSASSYTAQEFNFPAGALRVMRWKSGPVLHQITFETQLYVLKGTATVGVAGRDVSIAEADAVFQPSGILRNPDPGGETVILSFFVDSTSKAPQAKFVRGQSVELEDVAQWILSPDGKQTTNNEGNSDPIERASRLKIKRYIGDGSSLHYSILEAGSLTAAALKGHADSLIYVISGRMRHVHDGVEYLVAAGDAVRIKKNNGDHWDILEKSEIISTNMPFDPSRSRYKLQRSSVR